MKTMNVAIDGPAGAGKSSIARELAAELGFIYVDTGALYRAIALYIQQHNLCNKQDIIRQLPKIDLKIKFIGGTQCILLNGEDVTDDIRTPEISMLASKVSAIPEVRDFLFDLQQKIAKEHHVIMDGRDIGTVVLPDADLKIFLTASPEERASRRYLELQEKPDAPTYEQILQDIKKRDYQDTHREIAPLRQAEDAVLIDTTGEKVLRPIIVSIDKINSIINGYPFNALLNTKLPSIARSHLRIIRSCDSGLNGIIDITAAKPAVKHMIKAERHSSIAKTEVVLNDS